MQTLDNVDDVEKDDDGLLLGQLFLLDHIVLQVDETRVLVAEVVWHQTVKHQTQSLSQSTCQLHLATAVDSLLLSVVLGVSKGEFSGSFCGQNVSLLTRWRAGQ